MRFVKPFLTFILLFFMFHTTHATHILGGEITWECIVSGPDMGKYVFTIKVYRDCGTESATLNPPFTITGPFGDMPTTTISITDVSPNCHDPAQGLGCNQVASAQGAIEEVICQSNPVTLNGIPPATGWMFSYSISARPTGMVNGPANQGYLLRSVMYPYIPSGQVTPQNANPCFDSSPVFSESVALALCVGQPFTYNHLAADADVDSVWVRWGRPWTAMNTEVNWASGYSHDNPFPNPSTGNGSNGLVVLNGATGEVSMDVRSAATGSYASCFVVEAYRSGGTVNGGTAYQKIAEVYRDVAVFFRNGCALNSPPIAYIDTVAFPRVQRDGQKYYITTYPGDTVEFNITATDNGTNPPGSPPGSDPQNVVFSATGIQAANPLNTTTGCIGDAPCASFIPAPSQGGFTAPQNNDVSFYWTPDCHHLNFDNTGGGGGNRFYFSLRMQDDACPVPAISLSTLVVTVLPGSKDPVEIKCVSYEEGTGGDIDRLRIIWEQPEKPNSLQFNYYKVYGAKDRSGPYEVIDSIANYAQLSTTVDLSGGFRHFYMEQGTGICDYISRPGDTLSFIDLEMEAFPATGSYIAHLNWKSPFGDTATLPSTTGGVYELWVEVPSGGGNWIRKEEIQPPFTSFQDTGLYGDTVSYQIRVTDTLGNCQFTSNIQKGYFSDAVSEDIFAIALTEPLDGTCGDSNTTVSIVVFNYGTDDVSGFKVGATINGQDVSVMYNQTLLAGMNDTLTISGFNTIKGEMVEIKSYVDLSTDENLANDTLIDRVYIQPGIAPQPFSARNYFCTDNPYDTLYFPSGSVSAYQWRTENGEPLGNSDGLVVGPLHSSDTTFILSFIGNGCGAPDGSITIEVMETEASFDTLVIGPSLSDYLLYFIGNGSSDVHTYEWSFGDGNTAEGDSVHHSYTTNGNYNVQLIVKGDCGSDTLVQAININGIGIGENILAKSLKIFPNPVRDKLNINFLPSENVSIELMNLFGKTILKWDVGDSDVNQPIQLNIDQLARGTYLLKIKAEGDLAVRKFIKQ